MDLFVGSEGSSGADKIVLGNSIESYYVGFGNSDYARITNLDDGGTNRDAIELSGAANSTEIYYLNGSGSEDLVAVVENITIARLRDNLIYV